MVDRDHDDVDPIDAELLAISAALDDEGGTVASPSARGREFARQAEQIRRRVRVTSAEPVPDLTDSVLDELAASTRSRRRVPWPAIASVAAAFVVGVVASAAFLLDRDLDSSDVAAADLSRELVRAQAALTTLDADLAIVERGVHPDVPVRTYTGTLTYRSPEQLALVVTDTTRYPDTAWAPNNIEVVVDDDVAWRTRALGCPVDSLPNCLGPTLVDAIVGRPPFSVGWAAPLDLLVPAGELIEDDVDAQLVGDRVRVTTTVRESRSLVDALLRNGAFRQVHATDVVIVELDTDTLGLRSLEIQASDAPSRGLWATTWGYDDQPGSALISFDLATGEASTDLPTTPPVTPGIDAGFRVGPVDDTLIPSRVPPGFEVHRTGTQELSADRTDEIASWSDGRAWFAVRSSPRGGRMPASTAAPISLANGIGYVDRVTGRVELFTDDRRYRLTGSPTITALVDVAETLPVIGVDVGLGRVDDVPSGVLVPSDVRSLDTRGLDVTIVTTVGDQQNGDAGGAVVTITQRRGQWLPPPLKTDSFEVAVRTTTGRHSPALGTLTWAENGWIIELRSVGTDIDTMVDLAGTLGPAP